MQAVDCPLPGVLSVGCCETWKRKYIIIMSFFYFCCCYDCCYRPKSARNRVVIVVFGGERCHCCPLVFEFSAGWFSVIFGRATAAASQAGDADSSRVPGLTSGLRECPPWCSIVGATVTVHPFFCILHFNVLIYLLNYHFLFVGCWNLFFFFFFFLFCVLLISRGMARAGP